jgi:hypothetical protein
VNMLTVSDLAMSRLEVSLMLDVAPAPSFTVQSNGADVNQT